MKKFISHPCLPCYAITGKVAVVRLTEGSISFPTLQSHLMVCQLPLWLRKMEARDWKKQNLWNIITMPKLCFLIIWKTHHNKLWHINQNTIYCFYCKNSIFLWRFFLTKNLTTLVLWYKQFWTLRFLFHFS